MEVHNHAHPWRNDLDGFIKEEVKEPKGEEENAKHKKDMIKVKMIIGNSIKH